MLESLEKLVKSYGIDPAVAFIIVIILSIFGAVVSFAYKENLFGFKNIIRKLLRAKPEEKIDNNVIESDTADVSPVVSTLSSIAKTLISTPLSTLKMSDCPTIWIFKRPFI